MTKKQSDYLKYRSKKTGKSVEELRQEFKALSQKAAESGKPRGFATMTPEKRQAAARKGYQSGIGKKYENNKSQPTQEASR